MDDEARNEKRRRDREWFKKRWDEDVEFSERHIAGTRKHYRRHREEINARRRKRYATDPVYRLGQLRNYGITVEELEDMMERQHQACAICEHPFHGAPDIDHCHVTGLVRGLLCRGCN